MMIPQFAYIGLRIVTAAAALALLAPKALALPSDLGWTTFRDGIGTRVQYPADLFSAARANRHRPGQIFTTSDGRARLHIYAVPNKFGESPQRYLNRMFDQSRSRLTYDRVGRTFFAISAPDRGLILYRRCNFSDVRGGMMHCVDIRYPAREKRAWDAVVTRISLSLRPTG
jgi:hypothetical protein